MLLVASLVIFHYWLIAHAKNILTEIVEVQSRGRYRLNLEKIKYDYLKLKLELEQPVLTNVDTSSSGDKFEMHAHLISLQLEKLWPLIAGRQLLIDSILLDRPTVDLIHEKKENNQQTRTAFSLSVQMERLYQSIQSVLTTLRVANFRINKGAFIFNTAAQTNGPPLRINNIDFYIKGFKIDSSSLSQRPNSYTEDIQLRIAGQTIYFPDGNKSIKFSSFRFIANKGNLEVDSCSISSGDNDSTKTSFLLFAEKMRIKNVFIAMNDSSDYNRIDSLFFTRPVVSISLQIKGSKQDSSQTIARAIRKITSAAFGRVLVRYASINNVDFDIEVEKNDKLSTFNFVQDSLVISNLGIGVFPSMPLSASAIRFGLKEFVDYFRDSTYLVHFDSVRINNDQFSLFNINIESTERVKKGHQKIFVPVLQIQGIDWFQLISQKRLVALNATMEQPFISVTAAGAPKNPTPKKKRDLDRLLRQMFVLKNITIRDGTARYAKSAHEYIQVSHINSFLQPDLTSPDLLASLHTMVHHLNSAGLIYRKDGWIMTAQRLKYGKNKELSAASIDLVNDPRNLHIRANNVILTGISGEADVNNLNIENFTWANANIEMDLLQKQDPASQSLLRIGAVRGGPTAFTLIHSKFKVQAKISRVSTDGLFVKDGAPEQLQNLLAEGSSVDIQAEEGRLHAGKFTIRDGLPSSLSGIDAGFSLNTRAVRVIIPQVDFQADIQGSITHALNLSFLKIIKPAITLGVPSPTFQPTQIAPVNKFPELNIRNLEITDPLITMAPGENREGKPFRTGTSSITVDGIITNGMGSEMDFTGVHATASDLSFENNRWNIFSPLGTVNVQTGLFTLFAARGPGGVKWNFTDGSAKLSNIHLLYKRQNTGTDTIQLNSFHAGAVSMSENTFNDPVTFFTGNPLFSFDNGNLTFKNSQSNVLVNGLKGNMNNVTLDSFSYNPQLDIDSFMALQSFQNDYVTVNTGASSLDGIDVAAWLKDSVLKVNNITVNDAVMNDTRDKHLPVRTDIIKGLPVALIKSIPIKTSAGNINFHNARVNYLEVSDKTNKTGTINFTRMEADIKNIRNYNCLPGDSLEILASAYLMDTAFIRLRMKESYDDTLASFPLTISARPFDMRILNPFLLPVMSVMIKSGIADSIHVRALARDDLALGEMRFFYHGLKVEFLTAGDDQKKTLLTSLITFAANNLVIKTRNTRRIGKIFYERSRNRSFFNYLVRMVASGAASSVGAKRYQKYNRLYNEKIRELQLPGIDYLDKSSDKQVTKRQKH